MTNYETVVGLEIHAHLSTDSKMFCSCGTGPKGKEYKLSERDEPNVRVCPICTGNPGTLPVPNKKAIEDTILLGLALGSKLNPKFNFERKNYYYPDLPKAYQITSATNSPVIGGELEIEIGGPSIENGERSRTTSSGKMSVPKFVNLDHIHLEEDAGKLTHAKSGEYSLVDLNRAGTPLLEIITKPEISSGVEAVEFMKNLQAILRYLGISDADMEKGQMRCDANISVRKVGAKELGTKVEIKNMNSFKMIAKAIDYETKRQIEVLEEGGKLIQETRGWDDSKGKTLPQRSKEFANDYRYFPEPDIPPIQIGKGKVFDPEIINDRLPELPKEKKKRFAEEYGLAADTAKILSDNLDYAKYFEQAIEAIPEAAGNTEEREKFGKQVGSFMVTELIGKIVVNEGIFDTKVKPQSLGTLVSMIDLGEISGKIAKEVFPEMLESGKEPKKLLAEKGISQISNEDELGKIIEQVLAANPTEVERFKKGDTRLMGFFVGQIMQATKGQANPVLVNKILKEKLD